MEDIKHGSYNKNNSRNGKDLLKKIKIYVFSLIGIIIFFIPIKINNQTQTLLYHMSYFLENKASIFINISILFFISLSILKNIINVNKSSINKFLVFTKIFSLIILVFISVGKGKIFFIDDSFIFILKDLILNLSIVLPIASLFMPLLLDYGLVEITEAFTHKIMKKLFRVSGKVFLNFLVYFLVDNVCGAFVTYSLYKAGKLRERECVITILNFSVLSLSLTSDLCNKIDINMGKFLIIEMIVLVICNVIISRLYPLKKKKQSYYFKSGHKNVNCKKHKLNIAVKKYYENKTNKKFISLSLAYLNDVIYILMDLIPIIIIIFFIGNIVYNITFVMGIINNFICIIITKLNVPNSVLISKIVNLNFFNNILAIKFINNNTYYLSRIMIGLFISLQCISVSFLIPFIKTSIIDLNIVELFLVAIERFLIMLFIFFVSYNFYLGYVL
ncbi:hypothetical protein [Terrisporobacter mayombei]|uniref:Nucleoside recognition GATE domain-containing membrane protein YjiH n=1 Tax=Terrisporobacter mayombei TaxID=1541 RepID=A0ABY9Q2V1_9FIRM|nr:hypothetical protein [Terrisporobacter mayombei]MCC3867125.1 hypothetical protein [Terrisporobacter mayombei]WMT81385.1 hypothetical protein TEMA_17250 [Terrisporobacter mayombei]